MDNPNSIDSFCTTRAVCARFGISSRTLDRWLKDVELKFPSPAKIRERRYWRESALHDWERSQIGSAAGDSV